MELSLVHAGVSAPAVVATTPNMYPPRRGFPPPDAIEPAQLAFPCGPTADAYTELYVGDAE